MYVMAFQLSFDEIFKREQGLIAFYEMEDYSLYTDYFLDRQIERIKEIE